MERTCPCSYEIGDVLTEPLECLNTDNIILCETNDNIIEKMEGEFKYKLRGKLIDMLNGIVEVKGFKLHIRSVYKELHADRETGC